MKNTFVFFLLLINIQVNGQADYKTIKTDFTASWIGSDAAPKANSWYRFRKKITLNTLPEKVLTQIAVDSKYWLYINGKLVVFEGQLKRGPNTTDTYFDQIDLKPYLRQGENTIAILMWFWGRHGFCHNSSGQAGLLFEAKDISLFSDSSWRIKEHLAYGNSLPPHPNFRLPEHNVRYDARLDSEDWIEPNFNDNAWITSSILAKAGAAPWGHLWQRPFAQWKDTGLLPYISSKTEGLKHILKLPNNITVTPYFEIDAPEGLLIDIRTDNYQGGSENNIRTEYITKKGIQTFETPAVINGHEVIYTFPASVKVIELKYRETRYPANYVKPFTSDDPELNALWIKSLNTLNVNLRDAIQDPDRERAQWWGDAVIILEEMFYSADVPSHAAIRKSMSNLLEWQKPTGVLFSPIPAGTWDKELPAQMLASVGKYGIWKYYEHTADTAFVRYAYPFIKKYMALWQQQANGLVLHRAGGWDWHDWGDKIDVPVLDNAWYYMALESQRNMAALLGFTSEVDQLTKNMQVLKSAFLSEFYNGKTLASKNYKHHLDDRALGLSAVAGLVTPVMWQTLRPILDTTFHAGPYLEKYVLEAYFIMNQPTDGLKRMKSRYQKMIQSPLSTLWEGWDIGSAVYGGGTYNHGWTGGPLSILSAYVAGFKPLTPGYTTYEIRPQAGSLKNIETEAYTVAGNIKYNFNFSENSSILKLGQIINRPATIYLPIPKSKPKTLKLYGKTINLQKNKLPLGVTFSGTGDYLIIQINSPKTGEISIF